MYRHILIAVDGSDYAARAAEHGLALAAAVGAPATVITVTPTWKAIGLSELALGYTEDKYAERAKAFGDKCLESVLAAAADLEVPCNTVQVIHDRPYEAIVDAAAQAGCDLIVVGSHGRQGAARMLLGSQASRVITLSKVPVLVYRE
jgi:nucleotide-binding universal stress UspA family protein